MSEPTRAGFLIQIHPDNLSGMSDELLWYLERAGFVVWASKDDPRWLAWPGEGE